MHYKWILYQKILLGGYGESIKYHWSDGDPKKNRFLDVMVNHIWIHIYQHIIK